jgi:hypothetical protein
MRRRTKTTRGVLGAIAGGLDKGNDVNTSPNMEQSTLLRRGLLLYYVSTCANSRLVLMNHCSL